MSEYLDLNLHESTILSKDDNVLTSDIELFLQEVELAIKMEPTDVYGHYNTFCLQNYVFSQFVTEGDVIQAITEHIKNNCFHSYLFNWNVDAKFESTSQRNSILVIKFYISGSKPSEKFMKTFLVEA